MYQAIETHYVGPTNMRGARIIARSGSGRHRLTLPYPHELSGMACHEAAATALATKLGWLDGRKLVGGETVKGYCFVMVDA